MSDVENGELQAAPENGEVNSTPEDEDENTQLNAGPVDKLWLEKILSSHHQHTVTIREFTVKPWRETLSDIRTVSVTYYVPREREDRTVCLIVKLLPMDPVVRHFAVEAQFDLREIKFYTKVVPDLMEFQKDLLPPNIPPIDLLIPFCYHASHQRSQLVLADVRADGYARADFMGGLTLLQAEAALDAISRLHAVSLAMRLKEDIDLNEKYPFLFQTSVAQASDAYQQLVERGLFLLSDFLKDRADQIPAMKCLKEIHPKLIDVIAKLLTPSEPMKLITHTDFWCNNLMFNEGNECCILDWQMVTCSRPTTDIALLIISSLPTELRRTKSMHLLDVYWEHFMRYTLTLGVNVQDSLNYTKENLAEDYKKSQLLAIILCIGSVDLAMGNSMTEQRVLDLLQDLYDGGVFNLEQLFPDWDPEKKDWITSEVKDTP
ncbi:unnamed protein product [Bemisia tabaci]|uniref:CHK kinase-like domain-containing protein n=1 Tax=Bemisia tabaci TaxID=7038 RepID=A0A9P0F3I0_BEMTA|nr:unnamed protein product [Bemisia tabaci]